MNYYYRIIFVSVMFFLQGFTTVNSQCVDTAHQWEKYKLWYLADEGRVIDNANQRISHSEGQGYAMLMAVFFDDNEAFSRLWDWTQKNLTVPGTVLLAWKWQPRPPHTPDKNNAIDGDILIAWALLRASRKWGNSRYLDDSTKIIHHIAETQIRIVDGDTILLPGNNGFETPESTIVNPAYWIFPAFKEFNSHKKVWDRLIISGNNILDKNQYGKSLLPSDWLEFSHGEWKPAKKFETIFGYSNYRIPLYLSWSGQSHPINKKYLNWLMSEDAAWVDIKTGRKASYQPPIGAYAISELVQSTLNKSSNIAKKGIRKQVQGDNYYSDSLTLLSHIAYQERFCR
ncbi:glycosyl hydrolase family 8 [Vibrio caribbeanicus]|uniref:cellulase n=1 Tax=Vibrio caribbeanicus ATCC BAA-2122 TaxID=796620 RepID=E3BK54_9VIBR|nr:glycosyl hydrolase family 8 [Vibrio caribbeanicus]EFP96439.1 putative endoglucanase [Vibrio caribbeanicus ATCC BAA-2122]